MYLNMFLIWLGASLLMTVVLYSTRNWNGNYVGETATHKVSDPEQDLLNKIYRLQHECNEMQGVLLDYNTNETQQIYWDLLTEKTQAEVEWQNKYSHSRKVPSFVRI